MRHVETFLRFLWDFVVGDDWRIALGVVLALGATAALAGAGLAVWWLLPVATAVLLATSVWRVARPSR
jgi:hypothetical protein